MTISQPLLTRTIQEVRYGASGNRLICWPEVNGALTNPEAGATVTIYRQGGTAVVSGESVTEHADGYLYYDLDASDTAALPKEMDCAAEFTWVVGTTALSAVTYVRRVLFDVVRLPLLPFCPVRIDDLKNSHATIEAALSQGGETDAAGRYILPAWVEVLSWVRSQGYRPGLISDPVVLYQTTLHRALALYWSAHTQEPNDVASKLAEQHADLALVAQDRVVLKWDPAQTGAVDSMRGMAQPRLLIGPDWT